MSMSIARPLVLRRSANLAASTRTAAARRLESTAAGKATEAAKDTASKAAQGLTRVTSAAGPAIMGAARGISGALGKVGGRTGRLIKFVEGQIPTIIFYSRVGLELGKIVFRGQKMSPPSVATFQTYFQNAWKSVQNPGALLQSLGARVPTSNPVQQLRNVSTAQLAAAGVLGAELLGFFTVGEILGRFKLVGYHGEVHSAHH